MTLQKLNFLQRQVSKLEAMNILRMLAILLKAKIPLVNALEVIAGVYTKQSTKQFILNLKSKVASGASFSSAIASYPKIFSGLTVQLVSAGEQAAALPLVLELLCTYHAQSRLLASKIKKATFYPVIVLLVAMLMTMGLLLFIVPQFEKLFADFGARLPWFTQQVLHLSTWLQSSGLCFLMSIVVMSFGLILLSKRYAFIQLYFSTLKLHAPVLGKNMINAIIARCARTLSMTTKAGLPILQGLQLMAEVANQTQFKTAIIFARTEVSQGKALSLALHKSNLFPSLVTQMIYIGEQSGQLGSMLQEIALWYESQLDAFVESLSQSLEPIMMIILGLIVGSIVVAMYLPIFQLGNVV